MSSPTTPQIVDRCTRCTLDRRKCDGEKPICGRCRATKRVGTHRECEYLPERLSRRQIQERLATAQRLLDVANPDGVPTNSNNASTDLVATTSNAARQNNISSSRANTASIFNTGPGVQSRVAHTVAPAVQFPVPNAGFPLSQVPDFFRVGPPPALTPPASRYRYPSNLYQSSMVRTPLNNFTGSQAWMASGALNTPDPLEDTMVSTDRTESAGFRIPVGWSYNRERNEIVPPRAPGAHSRYIGYQGRAEPPGPTASARSYDITPSAATIALNEWCANNPDGLIPQHLIDAIQCNNPHDCALHPHPELSAVIPDVRTAFVTGTDEPLRQPRQANLVPALDQAHLMDYAQDDEDLQQSRALTAAWNSLPAQATPGQIAERADLITQSWTEQVDQDQHARDVRAGEQRDVEVDVNSAEYIKAVTGVDPDTLDFSGIFPDLEEQASQNISTPEGNVYKPNLAELNDNSEEIFPAPPWTKNEFDREIARFEQLQEWIAENERQKKKRTHAEFASDPFAQSLPTYPATEASAAFSSTAPGFGTAEDDVENPFDMGPAGFPPDFADSPEGGVGTVPFPFNTVSEGPNTTSAHEETVDSPFDMGSAEFPLDFADSPEGGVGTVPFPFNTVSEGPNTTSAHEETADSPVDMGSAELPLDSAENPEGSVAAVPAPLNADGDDHAREEKVKTPTPLVGHGVVDMNDPAAPHCSSDESNGETSEEERLREMEEVDPLPRYFAHEFEMFMADRLGGSRFLRLEDAEENGVSYRQFYDSLVGPGEIANAEMPNAEMPNAEMPNAEMPNAEMPSAETHNHEVEDHEAEDHKTDADVNGDDDGAAEVGDHGHDDVTG